MIRYNTKSSGGNTLWNPPDEISKGQTWIRGRGTLRIPQTLSEIQNPGIGGQWSLQERMSFADRIKKEKEQEGYLSGLAEEEEKEEALKKQKINPEEGNLRWNKETKTWSRLSPPRSTPEMPSWQKEQFKGIYGQQSLGNPAPPRRAVKDSFDKMM